MRKVFFYVLLALATGFATEALAVERSYKVRAMEVETSPIYVTPGEEPVLLEHALLDTSSMNYDAFYQKKISLLEQQIVLQSKEIDLLEYKLKNREQSISDLESRFNPK